MLWKQGGEVAGPEGGGGFTVRSLEGAPVGAVLEPSLAGGGVAEGHGRSLGTGGGVEGVGLEDGGDTQDRPIALLLELRFSAEDVGADGGTIDAVGGNETKLGAVGEVLASGGGIAESLGGLGGAAKVAVSEARADDGPVDGSEPGHETGPVAVRADEVCGDGVGDGVDDAIGEGLVVDDLDRGVAPLEHLASHAIEVVENAGELPVDVLHEGGELAVQIGQNDVDVVSHLDGCRQLDSRRALEGLGEDEAEGVCAVGVGSEPKLGARASDGDEPSCAGYESSWSSHRGAKSMCRAVARTCGGSPWRSGFRIVPSGVRLESGLRSLGLGDDGVEHLDDEALLGPR